jgi:hypothetical protein
VHLPIVGGPEAEWPLCQKPKMTPMSAIRLASAPNFASDHDGMMTTMETTIVDSSASPMAFTNPSRWMSP